MSFWHHLPAGKGCARRRDDPFWVPPEAQRHAGMPRSRGKALRGTLACPVREAVVYEPTVRPAAMTCSSRVDDVSESLAERSLSYTVAISVEKAGCEVR